MENDQWRQYSNPFLPKLVKKSHSKISVNLKFTVNHSKISVNLNVEGKWSVVFS